MTATARVERAPKLERRRAGAPYPIGWAIGARERAEIAAARLDRALLSGVA